MAEAAEDYFFRDRRHIFAISSVLPAMPFPRNKLSKIKPAQKHIAQRMRDEGYSVLIAGEGGRGSKPIEEREIKGGFYDLAYLAGVPVIPVGLYGFEDFYPKDTPFHLSHFVEGHGRKRITVVFGKPREYEYIEDDGLRSRARKEFAHQMGTEFVTMSKLHPYRK